MTRKVSKPWGYEIWMANNSVHDYCGKILFIFKGKGISWHYHKQKHETFYLKSGKLLIEYSETDSYRERNTKLLEPGDTFEVPIRLRHTMTALEDCEVIEISTFHRDEDSIRIC